LHGPTWQQLMRQAGFEARRRMHAESPRVPHGTRPPHRLFQHRCPVCGFQRTSSHRVHGWRCKDCVSAGLDGHLQIVEVSAPK
jgi:hypothetical protein